MSPDLISLLAEKAVGNIRELEGTLQAVLAKAHSEKRPIDQDLIREHFEGIIYTSKDDGKCALIFNPVKTYTKVVAVAHVPDWNVNSKTIEWKKLRKLLIC